MTPKRGIFKRSVSGILALVMVFGLVAACIPGLVTETVAAEETTVELPSYHVNNRARKDGLYIFYPAGKSGYALDVSAYGTEGKAINTVLDYANSDASQRFVVQVDQNLTTAVTYGIRSINSAYWLGSTTDSDNVVQTAYVNYRREECRWQFIPNEDGTVLIKHYNSEKYLCWVDYGNANTLNAAPSDGVFTDTYKWNMTQTHMQDEYFTTGIYWLETRLPDSTGTAPAETTLGWPKYVISIETSDDNANSVKDALIKGYEAAVAGTENVTTGEITKDEAAALVYESQQFVIQKISGGFYSIVNVSTGCYLAVGTDGSIVNGRSSSLTPNPEERWIIYPGGQTGNRTIISAGSAADETSVVSKFRIISAVDGRQITVQDTATVDSTLRLSGETSTLKAGDMVNAASQDWLLKDIRLDPNNVEKGDTQTTDSGVFADTFDASSTVTLPIKIFDYAADGMLFEYAANDTPSLFSYYQIGEGKGNFIKNADDTYTNVGNGNGDYVIFRMGNNMGFSIMSRSNGGLNDVDWSQENVDNGKITWSIAETGKGNGSASFGYNKYLCPYISELRLNASGADNSTATYSKEVLSYVFKSNYPTSYKAAVLIDGGTMNTATAGVNLSVNTTDPTIVADLQSALGYTMFGEQTFGRATLGLLESGLQTVNVNGKTYTLPRYSSEAVEYIAMVLQRSLEIRYQSGDGYLNYNYVDGETSFADLASGLDLAALLRGDTKADPDNATGVLEYYDSTGSNASEGENVLSSNFTRYGSYAETSAKSAQLIGTWADVKDNIKTCMDAAYWMLNSIFLEGSYNQPQERYNSLLLTKVTDQSGKTGYIFDSTFITNSSSEEGSTAVVYDSTTGTIRNSSAAGKSYTYWGVNRSAATYPFTPVRTDYQDENGNVTDGDGTAENPKGYQVQTQTPYILDGGINKSQSGSAEPEYTNANYNFVLQSNAYFVYHENEQLFFDFEGDDDVYLFINGQLVLDIGGAHTVTGTKMNLNDYVYWARELKADADAYADLEKEEKARVDALALVEGDTYSFDFYYMERHGWGSNMRIFTNFQLASGEIEAAKTAEQNDKGLSYGSVVDEEENVEYTFTLKNTGTANLVMPTFFDEAIGVTVDYAKGLEVAKVTDEEGNIIAGNGVTVFDKDGKTLEFSDLVFTYQKVGSDEAAQTYQFADKKAMTTWLTHELVIDRYVAGDGTYGVLTVGGIYYHLTNDQILAGAFHNEVEVSAYVRNDGQSVAAGGEAEAKNVFTGSVLYDSAQFSVFLLSRPLYYHWRGNELKITLADIMAEVQPAAKDENNPLSNLVKPTITAITNVRLTDETGKVGDSPNSYVDDVTSIFIDESFDIYTTYKTTGVKLIHLTIDYTYTTKDEDGQTVTETASATIPVQIFVLDVAASVYVLDYGLRVELSFTELTDNDVVTVDGRKTAVDVLGVTNEVEENLPVYLSRANATENLNSIGFNSLSSENGVWTVGNTDKVTSYDGTFTVASGVSDPDAVLVTYTPEQFLENRDEIYIALRVREADYTPGEMGDTDIHNEVEMFKKITVLPANVMYYEDDFKAIDYQVDKDSFVPTKEHDKAQQADQSEQYGHDSNAYAGSADVTMSGGIITEVTLDENQTSAVDAATFTFQGTGFELISRTNAQDSAMIRVKVEGNFDDGTTVKYYPIITKFDHISTTGDDGVDTDEVYQVPVFRLTDLTYGTYTVTVAAIPTYGFTDTYEEYIKPTKLYIDGVRIYNPLEDSATATEYGDQAGSVFTELRTLIFESKAAAIGLTDTNGVPTFNTAFGHLSYTEDLNGWFDQYSGNLQQYAIAGPNNEVYMNSGDAIVLFVKQTGTKGLLHIGVHDLHDGDFYGETSENQTSAIRYWTKGEDENGVWSANINIGLSGTEQYYPIDYTACPTVTVGEETYYQVTIQVSSGMVSFTNVKTVGLDFVALEHDDAYKHYRYVMGELQASENGTDWTAVQAPVVATLLTMKTILQSNAQAPGGDGYNPGTGDADFLWAVAVIGLCSVVCLVPLLRRGGRA